MIRAALVALVSLLVAVFFVWYGYGEAKAFVKALPGRLRAARQLRDFDRLSDAGRSLVRALDPAAVPRARRLTVAALATVIPGGHPRSHQ